MAALKPRKGVIKAADSEAQGGDDLAQLHPNLETRLNGRVVTVREYGFVEGLKVRQLLKGFLDGLYELTKRGSLPGVEEVLGLVVDHIDAVLEAVAQSADIDVQELKNLKDQAEGDLLLLKWWTANGPFFNRLAVQRVLAERIAAAEAEKQRAGQTSTPRSPEQGMATSSE